jgi:predicted ATPase
MFSAPLGASQAYPSSTPFLPPPILPRRSKDTDATDPELLVPSPELSVLRPNTAEIQLVRVQRELSEQAPDPIHGVVTEFVGRESELKELDGFFSGPSARRSARVVLLEGLPGIGKTRLIYEFVRRLNEGNQAFVLLSRFGPGEADERTELTEQLLESRVRLSKAQLLRKPELLQQRCKELLDPSDIEWGWHVLAALLGLPSHESIPRKAAALRADRALLRRASRDVLEKILRRECAQNPVILWLDDLIEADAEGLIELFELVVRLRELPILLLAACTEADWMPAESLFSADVDIRMLTISGLSEDLSERLARQILQRVERCPDSLIEVLVRKSKGNPLVLEQLVRLMLEQGVLRASTLSWNVAAERIPQCQAFPSTIVELAALRVGTLEATSRQVLELGALMGQSFLFEDLVTLLSLQAMDYEEAPWFSDARESWTRGTLLELVAGDFVSARDKERYEFRFESERQYLLAHCEPQFASRMHACFARLLSARNPEIKTLAHHLEAAGLHKQAALQWFEAARAADQACFNHSALELYAHCLGLLGPEDGQRHVDALLATGRLCLRVGQTGSARSHFKSLLQSTYAFKDLANSTIAYCWLARIERYAGLSDEAETMARRCLELAERQQDAQLVADALDELALCLFQGGQPGAFAESLKLLEKSIELRRQLGIPVDTANTLDRMAVVCIGRCELSRAQACLSEALNARQALDDQLGIARTLMSLGEVQLMMRRFDTALSQLEEGLEAADRNGDVFLRAEGMANIGRVHLGTSQWRAADARLREALELLLRLDASPIKVELLRLSAMLAADEQRFEDASKLIAQAAELAERFQSKLVRSRTILTQAQIHSRLVSAKVTPRLPLTQIRDLFLEVLSAFEEMGNWHDAADCLRSYGRMLEERGKTAEAKQCFVRAEKLDPLTQVLS